MLLLHFKLKQFLSDGIHTKLLVLPLFLELLASDLQFGGHMQNATGRLYFVHILAAFCYIYTWSARAHVSNLQILSIQLEFNGDLWHYEHLHRTCL